MKNHKKMLFDVDGPSGEDIESLWVKPSEQGYVIDNIPFYARGIAIGDVVSAQLCEDGELWFDDLVKASGHSTVRLWFAKAEDVPQVRSEMQVMGCSSEVSEFPRLIAVDVPPRVPYEEVRRYLDRKEATGLLEYEEGCLGQEAPAS